MSVTYNITTNFGAKDALPTNDPDKVIKGTEFTTEFTNIKSAFTLAAPADAPVFTGTATFDGFTAATGTVTGVLNVSTELDATLVTALSAAVGTGGLTVLGASNVTGTASFGGNLIVDTNTLYVDAANNRVGIGTTASTDLLRVGGTGSSYIGVGGGGLTASGIRFYRGATTVDGLIEVDSSENLYLGIDETGAIGTSNILFNVGNTERMRIDSNGNVGIGDATPDARLSVTTADSGEQATFGNLADDRGLVISTFTSNATGVGVNLNARGFTGVNGLLTFSTNNQERMRIDNNGNVGIGDTNPSYTLSVKAPVGSAQVSATAGGANLYLTSAVGNKSRLRWSGASGAFSIRDDNASSDRLTIDSSGNLLVGRTSDGGAVAVVDGDVQTNKGFNVYNASGKVGYGYDRISFTASQYYVLSSASVGVVLNSGATAWAAQSDENLKENVSDIGSVLDTIKDFRCVNYSLKTTESEAADKVGFIAQDWEHTFPNVVTKDEEGTLSMKYTETIPVLLKAIQEQQAMIEELKAEVAALKGA